VTAGWWLFLFVFLPAAAGAVVMWVVADDSLAPSWDEPDDEVWP
jgi:hypothetical protein